MEEIVYIKQDKEYKILATKKCFEKTTYVILESPDQTTYYFEKDLPLEAKKALQLHFLKIKETYTSNSQTDIEIYFDL